MPLSVLNSPGLSGAADTLAALSRAEGSVGHPHLTGPALTPGPRATRNAADLLHYLLVLHGRQPDMIELAARRHPASDAGRFLTKAADGFAVERAWLSRLAVAAGPLPSTPGQGECESAVSGQAHALAMLSRSDRTGTAFGAAAALLIDWITLRPILDRIGDRLGLVPPVCRLPLPVDVLAAADTLGDGPAVERAIAFGAQQLLLQQRGLLDLLEVREIARRDA